MPNDDEFSGIGGSYRYDPKKKQRVLIERTAEATHDDEDIDNGTAESEAPAAGKD